MTHATHGHPCDFCDFVAYGNGGVVAHGRRHVRRSEAVELFKDYGLEGLTSRIFLAFDDQDRIDDFLGRGFIRVEP